MEKVLQQKDRQTRDYNIDLIRILACIAVVGLHTLPKDLSTATAALYYFCGFAVPVFFVSSGYFLLNRGKVAISYLKHKCFGIIKVVIGWNLIIAILRVLKAVLLHGNIIDEILRFPIECVKCVLQKGTLWHFWYLGALTIIYLLLPVMSRLTNKKRKILFICTGVIAIAIELTSFYIGSPMQKYVIQTFRLWTWVFYFLLGSQMPKIRQWFSEHISVRIHAVLFFIYSMIVIGYQMYVGSNLITENTNRLHAEFFYDSLVEMIWIAILFSLLLRVNLSCNVKRIISAVVTLTMGIYITHPLIIKVVVRLIGNGSTLIALASWIITFALSLICTYIISKIKWCRFLIKV